MNALVVGLLLLQADASQQVDIVTASRRVVINGGSVRAVTVTSTGAAPVRSIGAGTVTIRDANTRARVIADTYTISVPSNTRVRVKIRCEVVTDLPCPNSQVKISNVASVVFESVDGVAEIDGVSGDVDAATLSGRLVISDVKGKVEAASQTHSVTVSNVAGATIARSTTGMMYFDTMPGGLTATNTTGEIRLSGRVSETSRYTLTTHIGQIRLDIPSDVNATIETNAPPERLRVRIANAKVTRVNDRRTLVVIGSGAARINARTLQGGIDVGRRQD